MIQTTPAPLLGLQHAANVPGELNPSFNESDQDEDDDAADNRLDIHSNVKLEVILLHAPIIKRQEKWKGSDFNELSEKNGSQMFLICIKIFVGLLSKLGRISRAEPHH